MKEDKYLVAAIKYLKNKPDGIFSGNKVQKEFPGYIASFGSAIIQSGLLPSVALFSQQGGQGKNKIPLMNAIFELVKKTEDQQRNFLDLALANKDNKQFEQEVIRAAISLKLAMRTFEIDK